MDISHGLAGFVQRYQSLSAHRDSEDSLIKDLILYLESLESNLATEKAAWVSRFRELELDLQDAFQSRRELQHELQRLEGPCRVNANPYVVVLVDGDGLLFKGDLIRQGIEGGKQAAYGLRAAILEQCGSHASNIEVIAKVYANLSGLAKAMRREGSLGNESDLKDFSLGFTQAKASFDFVDVGQGKERADNKIRELAKWHLRNSNCKHVILGISHDNGYAPFLDELFQDHGLRIRVTVLEGIATVPGLRATGVNILNLDQLFRSDKLVDRVPHCLLEVGAQAAASVTSASTSTPETSTVSTPATTPATTYAHAVKNAPPPQLKFPLKPKPAAQARPPQSKPAPWNPGPRGLDPLLTVTQTALDNIRKRRDHNKLCNNHYLRGPCINGDACEFEHQYKPTKEELVAIAFLTRLNPCSNGQNCEVENCIYGHHCPTVQDGMCTHPFCKFRKDGHPPGTKMTGRKS